MYTYYSRRKTLARKKKSNNTEYREDNMKEFRHRDLRNQKQVHRDSHLHGASTNYLYSMVSPLSLGP